MNGGKSKSYIIRESVENTSTSLSLTRLAADNGKYTVALWDFGAKANIAKELNKRGCRCNSYALERNSGRNCSA